MNSFNIPELLRHDCQEIFKLMDSFCAEHQAQRFGELPDNKNGQIAHRRIVAGWEIPRNHGRNNNSPGTGDALHHFDRVIVP